MLEFRKQTTFKTQDANSAINIMNIYLNIITYIKKDKKHLNLFVLHMRKHSKVELSVDFFALAYELITQSFIFNSQVGVLNVKRCKKIN